MKHTPGPWKIEYVTGNNPTDAFVYARIISPNYDHPGGIGAVSIPMVRRTKKQKELALLYRRQGEELCIVNAKLIAAAPETAAERDKLKAILQTITDMREDKGVKGATEFDSLSAVHGYNTCLEQIQNIILKSKG